MNGGENCKEHSRKGTHSREKVHDYATLSRPYNFADLGRRRPQGRRSRPMDDQNILHDSHDSNEAALTYDGCSLLYDISNMEACLQTQVRSLSHTFTSEEMVVVQQACSAASAPELASFAVLTLIATTRIRVVAI